MPTNTHRYIHAVPSTTVFPRAEPGAIIPSNMIGMLEIKPTYAKYTFTLFENGPITPE